MAPAASMKSFSELLAQVPSGAWVAISQDGSRVVAFGPEMRDVIEKAREAGENDPDHNSSAAVKHGADSLTAKPHVASDIVLS